MKSSVAILCSLALISTGTVLVRHQLFQPQFDYPGPHAKMFFRIGRYAHWAGLERTMLWAVQRTNRNSETYLNESVRAARLSLIRFPGVDIVGIDPFSRLVVGSISNQPPGFILIRPWPNANAPSAYNVFVIPRLEPQVRAVIERIESAKEDLLDHSASQFE